MRRFHHDVIAAKFLEIDDETNFELNRFPVVREDENLLETHKIINTTQIIQYKVLKEPE